MTPPGPREHQGEGPGQAAMRDRLIQVGESAPDFALPGADHSLYTRGYLLRGSRTLLVFYRRDCPASRLVLLFAERIYRRLQRAGLRVAGVAQDSHRDTLELADAYQITFPLLLDHPRCVLSAVWGVSVLPTQVLLDPRGAVILTLIGFSRREQGDLYRRLSRALECPEEALFHSGDIIPDNLEGCPGASPVAAEEGCP